MTNQYGVTAEQNDRLLELMGERRHEWEAIEAYRGDLSGLYWVKGTCRKGCGRLSFHSESLITTPPAVGDGHDVTLGEMIDLTHKLWPNSCVCIYAHMTQLWLCDGSKTYFEGRGKPPVALCAAILAAKE